SLPTGFDGEGVTIGVLSDSYNNLGGADDDINTGNLPANINIIEDLESGGIDEGRAMLQLIHDLAPGADLAFATAFISPESFADNIRALANAGADIIVDDIAFVTEPFFQDGVVSLAVDEVVTNNGVAYFSSAGNDSNIAYESTNINFGSDTIEGTSGNFYDFDPSSNTDTRQRITIPDGDKITLSFQWDDPFFTTNGVDTDLDIFLLNAATGEIVASSEEDNISNQTPSEFFSFTNNTGQTDFDVAIELLAGPEPGRIKYIPFDLSSDNPSEIYQEFATNSSTVFAHPAAKNAFAVGAVPYFDQENPESFTSVGPTTILFESDGTRKATPEIRQTPDIAAIDATDTTFFDSGNGDSENNGFPNFFGTSAAAPHAAAIAALVKQANPTFTPEQIYNRLESTAIDIGTPGYDNVTGHGLINAYDAIFGSVVPSSLNFTDNFEDGDLSLAYETNTTGAGRIQVTTENNPVGTQHLTLDAAFSNTFSLNEVILHVDTTGFNDVKLSFDQREFGDFDHPMQETFTGSNDSDGVALSVDGTNWFRLISLTGNNSTETYQTQTFNLSTFAANNGLSLGSDVQIKLQQFGLFAIDSATSSSTSNGFAFDNISVTGTALTGFTVTESDGSTTVTEAGSTDTFTIVLNSQPTSDVVINIANPDTGEATVSATSLTFTSANWDTPQTVTVTGVDDNLVDGTQTTALTLSVNDANSDDNFDAVANQTINVDTTDNDTAATAPVLVNNALTIDEGGTVTFTSSNLSATDADNYDANLTFRGSNITDGNFEVDGVVNNSFTQQQITDGKVKFIHDGNENAPSYDITVSDGSLTDSGSATVNFTNVNDAPTEITLSNSSVAENDIAAIIGNVTVTDVDSSNFTYTVNDNRFEVVNSQLKLKDGESLDFESENSITLEITATDDGNPNQSFTKSLTIAVTNVNEAPTVDDAILTVDENSTSGTEVGIITATDPENEALTLAITSGNLDPDNDSNLAFAIDSSTGTITVNDKDDLDFEVTPTFNLEVLATDPGSLTNTANITVNLNDVAPAVFDTVQSQNGFFTLNGGDPTNIKFTLANNNTENVNEVGVFVVDDENGSVDGNAPGSDGYLQAALQRSQVIFSAVSDRPSGFELGDIERVLEVDSDARLGFYLVSNGTTDTALAELKETRETSLPVFFSDSSNLQISELNGQGFNLNWSDEVGGSDFTGMDLKVELTQNAPAPGTELQGNPQNELIDLSNETGQVSVSVEVHREAAFDNLIGFYQVVDSNGGIDTNGDGIADFNPGDTGYEEAALTNRVTGLDLLQTDDQETSTFDGTFDGGSILASFMVVDGTVDEAINNNAEVYFSFLGANSDGVDHIRLLGDNTFGYEDIAGGGDFDYNDMVVKVDFTTV
ncbi:MAG: cadherin domain-containing protein, partial [Cyanobacteria bacterium P01_A01_bin.80]